MCLAVTLRIVDRYLGIEDYDWTKVWADQAEAGRSAAAEAERKLAAARPTDSRPSLPLERYAGTYADAWYGNISIAWEQSKLVMRFSHTPGLTGDMEHWQYDTFKVRWRGSEADAFRDVLAECRRRYKGGNDEARVPLDRLQPRLPGSDARASQQKVKAAL
jgi:hypothetical protein